MAVIDILTGVLNPTAVKTANYTAIGGNHVPCDASGGSFTVTLPASPNAGDMISVIADTVGSGTNTVTIARNGNTINGAAADLVLYVAGDSYTLQFYSGNWRVISKEITPHYAKMRRETAQTGIITATTTKITSLASITNIGGMVDTTNDRVNILRAGRYLIGVNVRFQAVIGDGQTATANIYVNGVNVAAHPVYSSVASGSPDLRFTWIENLAAGDYVELYCSQASGSNQDTSAASDQNKPQLVVQEMGSSGAVANGGGLTIQTAQTASFTAVKGCLYPVDMNAAGADFTVTAPASPAHGDTFGYYLARSSTAYECLFGRNGNNVRGGTDADPYLLLIAGEALIWQYDATTSGQGWFLPAGGDGRIPCVASIELTTARATSNGGVYVVEFETSYTTVLEDNASLFSSANKGFLIRRKNSGLFIGGTISPSVMDSGEVFAIAARKNGTSFAGDNRWSSGTDQNASATATKEITAVSGDVLNMHFFHNEGSNFNTDTTAGARPFLQWKEILK